MPHRPSLVTYPVPNAPFFQPASVAATSLPPRRAQARTCPCDAESAARSRCGAGGRWGRPAAWGPASVRRSASPISSSARAAAPSRTAAKASRSASRAALQQSQP
jgi:hypothetical protein